MLKIANINGRGNLGNAQKKTFFLTGDLPLLKQDDEECQKTSVQSELDTLIRGSREWEDKIVRSVTGLLSDMF